MKNRTLHLVLTALLFFPVTALAHLTGGEHSHALGELLLLPIGLVLAVLVFFVVQWCRRN